MYRLPAVDGNDDAFAAAETDEQSITPVDAPESATYGPTITILPPVDMPADIPADPLPVMHAALPEEQAGPMITILPPCDPPAELVLPPIESVTPVESTNGLANDFDTAWNEEVESTPPPTPPSPTPAPVASLPVTPLPAVAPPAAVPLPRVTPYAPTTAELSQQLLPNVRHAYGLAQHGAVFAAQTEFIQVLRRIAESKDAAGGVDTHAQALADGMRALDEADDFAPRGSQLEADLNLAVVASAHRTPVLQGAVLKGAGTELRPAEAIALYHQFARQQLARAVGGEQAGSMSLYGLGKVQNRFAREGDGQLQHERKALVMFSAALDAGPGNHLAANEIGVLLSRAGYSAEASELFRRAIDLAPTSTGYHNLAVTDKALGYQEQAAANEQYARQLAQRDRSVGAASRANGVEWVAPQEMSRVAQPMTMEPNQNQVTGGPQLSPQPVGAVQTAAKWPQKLVPGIFRR
jgi:tetratricopeptide (TPR) repeat protein